jgi:hypothetical protein
MLLSSTPEVSAQYLRDACIFDVLFPLIASEQLVSMMAAISIAFLTDDEDSCKTSVVSALFAAHPAVVDRLVLLLENTVHNCKGEGYSKRTFKLSFAVQAVGCLITKRLLPLDFDTRRIQQLLGKVVSDFVDDEKTYVGNEISLEGSVEAVRHSLNIFAYLTAAASINQPHILSTTARSQLAAISSCQDSGSDDFSQTQLTKQGQPRSYKTGIPVQLKRDPPNMLHDLFISSGQLCDLLCQLIACNRYNLIGDIAIIQVESMLCTVSPNHSGCSHQSSAVADSGTSEGGNCCDSGSGGDGDCNELGSARPCCSNSNVLDSSSGSHCKQGNITHTDTGRLVYVENANEDIKPAAVSKVQGTVSSLLASSLLQSEQKKAAVKMKDKSGESNKKTKKHIVFSRPPPLFKLGGDCARVTEPHQENISRELSHCHPQTVERMKMNIRSREIEAVLIERLTQAGYDIWTSEVGR